MPSAVLGLPFVIQGACMVVDEFHFHQKRGLSKWESIGHPLDSLTVLASFAFLMLSRPSESNIVIYIFICIFSCLFITKDEWIHSDVCPPLENWLHALLFILHPIVFLSAGVLWWQEERSILILQTGIVATFMLYQLLRWNIKWHRQT